MAAPGDDDDSFSPSNERLIDFYLRAKLACSSDFGFKAAYFLDADVCSARPEELVRAHGTPARVQSRDAGDSKQWYFFSPARFVGTKSKKSQRRSRTIDGTDDKETWHAEGRPKPLEGGGGFITKLSYHVKIGPNAVEKPGWIMAEYSLKDTSDGDMVLCKVYKSPRGPGRSCKRKAADDLEVAAPSTKRPRMTGEDVFSVEIDHQDHDAVFAGGIEQDLLPSVDHHAAAPHIVEQMQSIEESHQPEPQFAQASIEELESWMMTDDVEDAGTTVQVPNGEDPYYAYYMRVLLGDMEDATIQTVHGPPTDDGVIAALATGVTVEELLPCPVDVPASAMPPQPATATRKIEEHDLQLHVDVPELGETRNVEPSQPEP